MLPINEKDIKTYLTGYSIKHEYHIYSTGNTKENIKFFIVFVILRHWGKEKVDFVLKFIEKVPIRTDDKKEPEIEYTPEFA